MGEMQTHTSVVQVAAFGRHLIGRDIGLEIRKRHFAGTPDSWPMALDFSGVEQATESCIDELLGTLARTHGLPAVKQLGIIGASRAVRETIAYVLSIVSEPPLSLNAETIQGLLSEANRASAGRRKTSRPPKKK